jgi:hypothetical protein
MKAVAALAVLGFASIALAAPKAAPARFSALPSGKLPRPPEGSAPQDIAGSERAAYFSVAGHGHGGFGVVYVFPSDGEARGYETNPQPHSRPGAACYAVRRLHERFEDDWPLTLESRPHLGAGGGETSLAVHYERLVLGRSPRLELADAWVDPGTRGARAISRGSLPLVPVATGPRGIRVFAAREGRSVHFAVTRPNNDVPGLSKGLGDKVLGALLPGDSGDGGRAFLESIVGASSITRADGGMGRSDCGHARVRLDADGGGSAATIQVEVVMRPAKDEAEQSATVAREIRVRSLAVHLSVSQTSSDREPVLSVSFGWLGRPRSMMF